MSGLNNGEIAINADNFQDVVLLQKQIAIIAEYYGKFANEYSGFLPQNVNGSGCGPYAWEGRIKEIFSEYGSLTAGHLSNIYSNYVVLSNHLYYMIDTFIQTNQEIAIQLITNMQAEGQNG